MSAALVFSVPPLNGNGKTSMKSLATSHHCCSITDRNGSWRRSSICLLFFHFKKILSAHQIIQSHHGGAIVQHVSCPPLGKPMSVLRFPISQGLICCFCGVKQLKLRGYNKHTHTHTRSPPDKMPVHRRDLTLILSLWLSILNQSAAQVLLLLKGFSCVAILCKTSNSIWKDAPEVQPFLSG